MPIVAAQYFFDLRPLHRVSGILNFGRDFLQHTSRADVDQLIEMKKLANQLSHYSDRQVAEHPDAKNVLDYYRLELESSDNPTSLAHNREFVEGFPTVKLAYEVLTTVDIQGFENKIEAAYQEILESHDKNVGRGFLADCIAVAIYLVLSQNPQVKFVV